MKRIDPKSVIIGLLSGVCIMLMMGQGKEENPKTDKPDMSGVHDFIKTKRLFIMNDEGVKVGSFTSDLKGGGSFGVNDHKGRLVISASSANFPDDSTFGRLSLSCGGKGQLDILPRLMLGASDDNNQGGFISVHNKTGKPIVQLHADEYGNGVVGAYNRKGGRRTLQPGP